MNSTVLKALSDELLASNASGAITAEDLRTVITDLIRRSGGLLNIDNTDKTEVSIPTSTWTTLDFTQGGAEEDLSAAPFYTDGLIVSNGLFSTEDFDTYATLHARCEVLFTTSSANQVIKMRGVARNSGGTIVKTIEIIDLFYKTANSYAALPHLMVYVNPLTTNGTYELQVYSDDPMTAAFSNCLIRVAG